MKQLKNVKDLTGQRFGRLTVIGLQPTETRKTFWVCECDCGNMKVVRSDILQSGNTRSCGCLKKEQDETNLTKGYARKTREERGFVSGGTRLYQVWQGMKKRCSSPSDVRYHRYGGRGIKVCDDWNNDYLAFHNWAITNGYSEELTIDRIDSDGDYEPSNCRWATKKEQANNRSTNIKITIGNSTRTLTEWCEIFNLDSKVIFARYHRNENIGIDELFNGSKEVI